MRDFGNASAVAAVGLCVIVEPCGAIGLLIAGGGAIVAADGLASDHLEQDFDHVGPAQLHATDFLVENLFVDPDTAESVVANSFLGMSAASVLVPSRAPAAYHLTLDILSRYSQTSGAVVPLLDSFEKEQQ